MRNPDKSDFSVTLPYLQGQPDRPDDYGGIGDHFSSPRSAEDFARAFGLRKRGQEYIGACPLCDDGNDRFRVPVVGGAPGCRQCLDKSSGDAKRTLYAALFTELDRRLGRNPGAPSSRPRSKGQRERRRSAQEHIRPGSCNNYCQSYPFADGREGKVVEHRLDVDNAERRLEGRDPKLPKSKREYATPDIPFDDENVITHAAVRRQDGEIQAGEPDVVVCEGPKAASFVWRAGFGAASWLGGTSGAQYAVFDGLKDLHVVLWPDSGAPGAAAMDTAGREIAQRAASMRMVDVSTLDDNEDAADVGGPDAIRRMIREARAWQPALDAASDAGEDATLERARRILTNHVGGLGGYRGTDRSVEARAAEYAADELRGRFRYDGQNWYGWERNAWRLGVKASEVLMSLVHTRYHLAASASEAGETEVAQLLAAPSKVWTNTIGAAVGDFQSALHIHLLRPRPQLDHSLIATPSTVVEWSTGKRTKLDPHIHDVTATTLGEFRPDDLKELIEHLRTRLSHAFTPDDFAAFSTMLGLAITRWDIDPAIIWLTGPSGSGKSWIARLVQTAFGDLAHQVTDSTLTKRDEIGVNLADLIVSDPLFGVAIEVTSIRDSRLNSLTGRDSLSSRYPYGKAVHGVFTGRLLATSVNAPRARAHEGLARRVEAFGFSKPVKDSLKIAAEQTQQDLDAVVTLAVGEARVLHQERAQERALGTTKWERPRGNATRSFLAAADDVAGWLTELGDDRHGDTIPDVCASYESGTGEKLTPRSLGRHLWTHPRWTCARDTTGSKARRLVLRSQALPKSWPFGRLTTKFRIYPSRSRA